jgi:HlyD family secretion protein
MKRLLKVSLVLLVLGGLAAAAYAPTAAYWREYRRIDWRLEEVTRGRIVSVINSTGTVKPTLSVSVGSFVSGPILELNARHNQEVKKDEVLARIDPRIYAAAVASDRARLATQRAELLRVRAELQRARNDEERALTLYQEDETFISQAELDQVRYGRESLEAQEQVAQSAVEQAQAGLDNSLANLAYTEIRSPVDGMVIDRKIEPGQTLAAQFQTPELFVVAPDLREKMHVHASVDEADIGQIMAAKLQGAPVHFTVDAYPDELFQGQIEEVRYSSTTTQNVVTYPVIVAVANPDLKLLPGMTASLSFQVGERTDVLRVPNAALRYFPLPEQVRPEDRPLVEGRAEEAANDSDQSADSESGLSAADRAEVRQARNRRHVWVVEGELLRAVEVTTGVSDSQRTELVSGELKPGDKLVTGIRPKRPWGGR